MRSTFSFGILLLAVLSVILSCSTKSTQPTESPVKLENLTGTWSGSLDIFRVGQCQIGGVDSARTYVTTEWTVSYDGVVTIEEAENPTSHWKGSILPSNLYLSLNKEFSVDCKSGKNTDTLAYTATVIRNGHDYSVVLEGIETWCPTEHCVFMLRYDLQRQ